MFHYRFKSVMQQDTQTVSETSLSCASKHARFEN